MNFFHFDRLVVQGNELLNPRTDKEKEKLKKKPKTWRLACQTTVGKPDSRGLLCINLTYLHHFQFSTLVDLVKYFIAIRWMKLSVFFYVMQVVIQQLPEWKAHEWKYERLPPKEDSQVS
ncbi:hypothetical protein SLA2020_189840 [Shorea laevis]